MTMTEATIDRIRDARKRISEKFQHNPKRIVAHYIELQQQYRDRVLHENSSGKLGNGTLANSDNNYSQNEVGK